MSNNEGNPYCNTLSSKTPICHCLVLNVLWLYLLLLYAYVIQAKCCRSEYIYINRKIIIYQFGNKMVAWYCLSPLLTILFHSCMQKDMGYSYFIWRKRDEWQRDINWFNVSIAYIICLVSVYNTLSQFHDKICLCNRGYECGYDSLNVQRLQHSPW